MNFVLDSKTLVIEYSNLAEIKIKYYVIDPEILFSRAPFLLQNTEDFAYSKPCWQDIITLNKALKELWLPIHDEF